VHQVAKRLRQMRRRDRVAFNDLQAFDSRTGRSTNSGVYPRSGGSIGWPVAAWLTGRPSKGLSTSSIPFTSFEAIGGPNLALTCSNGLGKPLAGVDLTGHYSNLPPGRLRPLMPSVGWCQMVHDLHERLRS
jgi:hypothetical protein